MKNKMTKDGETARKTRRFSLKKKKNLYKGGLIFGAVSCIIERVKYPRSAFV